MRNAAGDLRYPQTQRYLDGIGTVTECELIATIRDAPGFEEYPPVDVYCNTVTMEGDGTRIKVGEEALLILE